MQQLLYLSVTEYFSWIKVEKLVFFFFFSFGCWLLTLSKPILKSAAVLEMRRYLLLVKNLYDVKIVF